MVPRRKETQLSRYTEPEVGVERKTVHKVKDGEISINGPNNKNGNENHTQPGVLCSGK